MDNGYLTILEKKFNKVPLSERVEVGMAIALLMGEFRREECGRADPLNVNNVLDTLCNKVSSCTI